MPIKFNPRYVITPIIAHYLMRIEALKEHISHLPINVTVLASLRETARLYTTHYSTMIEGNRLSTEQVEEVIKHNGHFPGRERDEGEVKGYYEALHYVEQCAAKGNPVSEAIIQKLHALVMSTTIKKHPSTRPSPKASEGGRAFTPELAEGSGRTGETYRDGQNVIRDGRSGAIVYLPPEAKDVPGLMKGLVQWTIAQKTTPCPIVAAIAHYQFATIHPYYDGNGRTARLLTTLILHLGGYDLKGLYSLEEYYARNLSAYYEAISIGPSHNYYEGREESDITQWIEYFVGGMAHSFEKVAKQMSRSATIAQDDHEALLRTLDPKKRKALELFQQFAAVTSAQIGKLFGFKPRTSAQLCKNWTDEGLLVVINPSNKKRSYALAPKYEILILGSIKK